MAGGSTNVFFVPYRPTSKSKKFSSADEPEISQQKHAAREYHRKAKIERVAKLNALHNQRARSTSVAAAQTQPDSSSRPLLPRNRTFQNDQDYDKSFAVFDAGTGQLDPFNACVPSGVPSYALDILDYGEPPKLFFSFSFTCEICLPHITAKSLINVSQVVPSLSPTLHFAWHTILLLRTI